MENNPNKLLLPEKSAFIYCAYFNDFIVWFNEHRLQNIEDEEVYIVYLDHLRSTQAPSTLYKIWSCLKCCLLAFHRIKANEFKLVKSWLKNNSTNYTADQSPIFTKEEIWRFLQIQDPLLLKYQVAAAFMYYGGLRRGEAYPLCHKDIQLLYDESMCLSIHSIIQNIAKSHHITLYILSFSLILDNNGYLV